MKYYKRLKVYKASNVQFDPENITAYSYGWWKFVAVIRGKVIFNNYSYSVSTNRHQSKVRQLMEELGILIDQYVYVHQSLGTLTSASLEDLYYSKFKYELKREAGRPNTYADTVRLHRLSQIKEDIKWLRSLGIKCSAGRIAEIKEEVQDQYIQRMLLRAARAAEKEKTHGVAPL